MVYIESYVICLYVLCIFSCHMCTCYSCLVYVFCHQGNACCSSYLSSILLNGGISRISSLTRPWGWRPVWFVGWCEGRRPSPKICHQTFAKLLSGRGTRGCIAPAPDPGSAIERHAVPSQSQCLRPSHHTCFGRGTTCCLSPWKRWRRCTPWRPPSPSPGRSPPSICCENGRFLWNEPRCVHSKPQQP